MLLLTEADLAREQLDRLKGHWQDFWVELEDFHANKRWLAVGYTSFKACVEAELGLDESHAYRLLDAARIRSELAALPGASIVALTERQARELKALPPPLRIEVARQVDFATTPAPELRKLVRAAKDRLAKDRPVKAARPAPDAPPATAPEGIRLEVGLARDLARHVPRPADLIVTSPPYGLDVAYADDDGVEADDPAAWFAFMNEWLDAAYAVAREHGRLALNVPLDTTRGGFRPTYAQAVVAATTAGWEYRASVVWNEGNITHSTGRGSVDSPNSPHVIAPVEMVALFSKGEWDRKRQGEPSDLGHDEWLGWTNGLWTFPGESRPWEGHPAPFPEELPRRLIKLLSFPGDLIVDPFLGSGTTALAAARLGRRFVGVDRSAAYVDAARRRLAAAFA